MNRPYQAPAFASTTAAVASLASVISVIGALTAGCAPPGVATVQAVYRGDIVAARGAYDALGEPDQDTLRAVAGTILARHAQVRDADVSRAAFAEFARAGTRAQPLLERLVFEGHGTLIKARALSQLAALGDGPAAETLRLLAVAANAANAADDVGPGRADRAELLRLGIPHYDYGRDLARLHALLVHPDPRLRSAGVARLSAHPADAKLTLTLRGLARRDPAASVRAASLAVLARRAQRDGEGDALLPLFEAGLSDPERAVTMAAARGLPSLGGPASRARLLALIDGEVTAASIEAARMLLSAGDTAATELTSARGLLHRALREKDDKLRAQATVAWSSVPVTLRPLPELAQALKTEQVAWVKLQLALALGPQHADAVAALRTLMAAGGMDGITAATTLALAGEADGLAGLQAMLGLESPSLRAAVARALIGRLDRAHGSRALLFDDDRTVRLAAAGAILGRNP